MTKDDAKDRKKIVLPGDHIGISEEFIPGEGTYEREGQIYAATLGELELNSEEMVAKVKSRNPPVVLEKGDIIIGVITGVKQTMAVLEVLRLEKNERAVSSNTLGTIHISKISNGYTQDISREFRLTDIIRAKVMQTKPSLQLTTLGPYMGVIKANCRWCRAPLVRERSVLYCKNCDRTETRKMARDYGDVYLPNREKS